MISTASTFTWTIGAAGCPVDYVANCAQSRGGLFLPNESLTWVPNSIFNFELENNLGLDTSGDAGFDTVTLGWQGAGGPTVTHAIVFNIADSKYWLGEFGLNPRPTNFTTFADPQTSYMQALYNNNSIPSISYGYTAGAQYRFDAVFGSLVLGGYDQNRFTPTNVTFGFYEDISRDLLVNLQAITTDNGNTDLLPGGSIPIFIDSTIPMIYLPLDACRKFEDAFNLTYDSTYNLYLLNNSQRATLKAANPSVTFTIGPQTNGGDTVDITLPYGAFDKQVDFPIVENPNSSYYFPLQRAANSTQYTLGRTFLQEAYLIADYQRSNFTVAPCAWVQSQVTTSNITPILSPNETAPESHTSGVGISSGALAGVVIGIVVVVAILGVILFLFRRRRRSEKRRLAELEAKESGGAAEDSSDINNENKPFISGPIGGELGGGDIHELTAPHKPYAQEMESPYIMDPNKHGYSEMESGEYFGPGKDQAHEMHGSEQLIYEMQGSDVHEMPTIERRRDEKQR